MQEIFLADICMLAGVVVVISWLALFFFSALGFLYVASYPDLVWGVVDGYSWFLSLSLSLSRKGLSLSLCTVQASLWPSIRRG